MNPAKTAPGRHMPGEGGAWVFIFGDMIVFAAFFIGYIWYRSQAPASYDAAQLLLDQNFGLMNTLLLLTSSWFLALSLRAYRRGQIPLTLRLMSLTVVLGGAFIAAKIFEWKAKFAAGITILTDEFFMFYFMFTGIHLLHVIIGLGVLFFLMSHIRATPDPEKGLSVVESGAAFWHLVDLLWVVLFALLYLMR